MPASAVCAMLHMRCFSLGVMVRHLSRLAWRVGAVRKIATSMTPVPADEDNKLDNPERGILQDVDQSLWIHQGGSSSVVERQLPKLNVAGSIPVSRSTKFFDAIDGNRSESSYC